jgi:prepilin-type N-terminal cleavage/methylation domain-containing protein
MRNLKSNKGFTLIELAIVLVIIGIIMGAVLKGQDLIQNARYKQFISKVKAWEVAQWTYLDRMGRFAGDANKNGKIGDDTNDKVKDDLTNAKFINPPYEGSSGSEQNTVTIGSATFYVFFGNDGSKNIMVICASDDCNTAFDDAKIQYLQALDASLDGSADGSSGQVIGTTSSPSAVSNKWVATYNNAPNAADWSTSTKALVYYFDSKR